jgi:hypothetical protein
LIIGFTSKRTSLSLFAIKSRLISSSTPSFNHFNVNKKVEMSKQHGCCPPNAHKYLAPDYKHVGNILTLEDGTEIYRTGDPSSKKAVLLIPDIFGWNGGRTRNIADFLAENGYYTVIPKLLIPPVDGGTDGDGFIKIDDFPTFFATLRDRFSYDSKDLCFFFDSFVIELVLLLCLCSVFSFFLALLSVFLYLLLSYFCYCYQELEPKLISTTNHLKDCVIENIYLLGFCW